MSVLKNKLLGVIAVVLIACSCYAAAENSAPLATLFPGETDWAAAPGTPTYPGDFYLRFKRP